MASKFKIAAHNYADKSFLIYNDLISMAVDYDDVDHKTVDREARRVVKALNEYDFLRFRMDGLEK